MAMDEERLNNLTEKIIGCAFRVHRELGGGFLEKVYENAMMIELRSEGLSVVQQAGLPVYYRGQLVGEYVADLIVEGVVIIELKAVVRLMEEHTAQALHYLKATELPVCLLLNFGQRVDVKRLVGPAFMAGQGL